MDANLIFKSEECADWEVDHGDIFLRPRRPSKLPHLINERHVPLSEEEPPLKRFRLEEMIDKGVWSRGFLEHFNRVMILE